MVKISMLLSFMCVLHVSTVKSGCDTYIKIVSYLLYIHVLGPELQCLLKVKVDLNLRTYLNFTKSALQSFSLS